MEGRLTVPEISDRFDTNASIVFFSREEGQKTALLISLKSDFGVHE